MNAEQRFLLRLVGAEGKSGGERPAPDHWRRLLQIAPPDLHPYIDHCVRTRLPPGSVPVPVLEKLSRARRASAALHLRRQRELRLVLEELARRHIPVVVLKGMALAHLAYPDPATRTMADIDLLVADTGWEAAREALLHLGLRVPERWSVRPATGPASKDERDRPFERPGTRVLFELHAALDSAPSPLALTHAVIDRSVPAALGGIPARVLCPADFLMHVCLHLSSAHRFEHGLRPLLDVLLLFRLHEGRWDWPSLALACRQQQSHPWMVLTLKLARALLGAPVPDGFFDALPRPARLDELEALAIEQVWSAAEPPVPPGLVTVASAPAGQRMRAMLNRLNPWRPDEGSGRAIQRFYVDLKTRLPLYAAAWRRHALSPAGIERAVALRRGRERIGELIAEGALRDPARSTAAGPGTGW
jgi:hypothetical protein